MREKKALYLSVNVFRSRKCSLGTLFLFLLLETGPSFYVVIPAAQRFSRLQCKGTTFISQLFIEDRKSGTVPGIEPATSRSAVKRSTDWANPERSIHPWK